MDGQDVDMPFQVPRAAAMLTALIPRVHRTLTACWAHPRICLRRLHTPPRPRSPRVVCQALAKLIHQGPVLDME